LLLAALFDVYDFVRRAAAPARGGVVRFRRGAAVVRIDYPATDPDAVPVAVRAERDAAPGVAAQSAVFARLGVVRFPGGAAAGRLHAVAVVSVFVIPVFLLVFVLVSARVLRRLFSRCSCRCSRLDAPLTADGLACSEQHRRADEGGESYLSDVFLFHNFSSDLFVAAT
jgi:hypothetical protein